MNSKYARCPYRARPSRGPCPARTTRSPPAREMLTPEQLSAFASVPCTARPSPTRVNGSGKDTTLQCDNDLKSGTGCSPSPLPAVPSKLHAVFATHETERASARAAQEVVHPAYSTSLPGATALKSGRGYTDLTAEAT